MKLAIATRFAAGEGSSRVRVTQLVPHLEAVGMECRTLAWGRGSPGLSSRFAYVARALRLARWADVFIIQKPFQPRWFVDLLARVNTHLVVDVDDALWAPPIGFPGYDHREIGARLLHAVARARLTVTGSPYLAGWIQSAQPTAQVAVVPSSVDLTECGAMRMHGTGHPIRLCWKGSPGNLRDLQVISRALSRLASRQDVVLHVISAAPLELDGIRTEHIKWSQDSEFRSITECDIGLMPIWDDERSRGRCGHKAIHYMAAGLPVVASDVPGPSFVVRQDETGLLASDDATWIEGLERLATSVNLRRSLGQSGRQTVEAEYTSERSAARLAALLKAL